MFIARKPLIKKIKWWEIFLLHFERYLWKVSSANKTEHFDDPDLFKITYIIWVSIKVGKTIYQSRTHLLIRSLFL